MCSEWSPDLIAVSTVSGLAGHSRPRQVKCPAVDFEAASARVSAGHRNTMRPGGRWAACLFGLADDIRRNVTINRAGVPPANSIDSSMGW